MLGTNKGPSFLILDPRRSEYEGEKVPSVKREKDGALQPASVTHLCLHLFREAGCIQPRQSNKKKRPAQNQCGEPSPAPILSLPRGGGVGLRKRPLAEVTALKRPCGTPKRNPLQSQWCLWITSLVPELLRKKENLVPSFRLLEQAHRLVKT